MGRRWGLPAAIALCSLSPAMPVQAYAGASPAVHGATIAVNPRGLSNLIAFSRLFGYVRYFYPGDQAAATDWNAFAARNLAAVEALPDAISLARSLQRTFAPYAPDIRAFVTGTPRPSLPPSLRYPASRAPVYVTEWEYSGFGIGNMPSWMAPPGNARDSRYYSRRQRAAVVRGRLPSGFHDPGQPYVADLSGGVSVLLPLSLYADGSGTLPHMPLPPHQLASGLPFGIDRAAWLANIAIAWNAIQHFYTYFDTVRVGWDRVLSDALATTMSARNRAEYDEALERMLARLDDGHTYLFSRAELRSSRSYRLPVLWDWIEGKLIVTQAQPGAADPVRRGDEVLRVDGKLVRDLLSAPDNVTGGTPQHRRNVTLWHLLDGQTGATCTLQVATPTGRVYDVTLRRLTPDTNQNDMPEPRPVHAVATIQPGIVYVDLTRLTAAELPQALIQMQQVKGIVFDARGYPADGEVAVAILSHLSSRPLHTAPFLLPSITVPDHAQVAYRDVGWTIQPAQPTLAARLVFLIDGNGTVSAAETILGIVDAYHLGPLVGSPTDGTNGDMAYQELLGDTVFTWTGLKITKHDGTALMHVGILPTVSVQCTVKGVIAGRDEVLDRGVQVLRHEMAGRHV